MSWWDWVTTVSGTESPKAMQATTGIDGPNFSKWKAGQVPRADTVAKFARGYGVPVLSAFVAAGFLTEQEARMRPASAPSLDSLSDDQLVDAIRDRLRKAGESGGRRSSPAMKRRRPAPGGLTENERQKALKIAQQVAEKDREGPGNLDRDGTA